MSQILLLQHRRHRLSDSLFSFVYFDSLQLLLDYFSHGSEARVFSRGFLGL